jgi:hypothetical protein
LIFDTLYAEDEETAFEQSVQNRYGDLVCWNCTKKSRNIQGTAGLPSKSGRSRTGSIYRLLKNRKIKAIFPEPGLTLKELFTTVVIGEQHSIG